MMSDAKYDKINPPTQIIQVSPAKQEMSIRKMMIVNVIFWRALSYMAINLTLINASSFKRIEWWKLEFLLYRLS